MSPDSTTDHDAPSWSSAQPPPKPAGSYILGLGLIALMMVISTVLVARELTTQADEVAVLNVAAELPGLTYEIGSAVQGLAEAPGESELLALRASLEESLATYARTYIGLQFGDADLGLPGAPSPEIDRLLNLADPVFNQVIGIARAALNEQPTRSAASLLELSSSAFRSRMETVVFQYQREAESRVQSLARLEFLLLSAGLLLLLAEAMFLFRPAVRATSHRWQEIRARHAAERERDRAELEYRAQFDALTGLPNRVLFRDRLDQAIKRAHREGGWASVLFVNLDNFSVVNDQLGHEVGDELLQRAAARIEETVRAADTVAHLGGDEFAIVVEGSDDASAAESVAQKAVSSLAEPYRLGGRDLHVSASIGVAIFPVDGDDADGLLRDSALAMYAAKETGRNTFEFYTPELRERTSDRLALIGSLRTAIDTPSQLSLWYQPKVDLATGSLTGVEALVRWHHPEQGLIMPDRFISVAEETGLIIPLDRWVIGEAARQMRQWLDDGLDDFVMSVNVSSRQFHHGNLAGSVARALDESGIEPARFEIEVTEGTLIENIDVARVTLDALRDLGVRISIDDFGTGYSSLSYLKRLPIDVLKIDRSFISALPEDPEDAAISEAIVRLGHTLKMEIVAEGVETQAQFDFLRKLGCDTGQGYHIAAPLPVPQFVEFVATAAHLLAG
ncbi:MAG: EAL domain-containing protein [Acidimicrobiia bacterium]|nr:EAL domain-containing protein [Acidimicrobiia bacterium]